MDVSPRINIFLGRNGQGKTNLLEGLGFLALGRSQRGSRDREVLAFGAEGFHVEVDAQPASGRSFSLEATFTPRDGKRLKVDGQPVARMADLVGRFCAVLFGPDEIDLAKGAPEHRRRYLDYTLSITSADYLRRLLEYRRVVAQKNRLLKSRGRNVDREIDVWDEELAETGARLMSARAQLVPDLATAARAAYATLAGDPEAEWPPGRRGLEVALETTVDGAAGDDLPEVGHDEIDPRPDDEAAPASAESAESDARVLRERLRRALGAARARERQFGFAVVGPHRDRLRLRLRGRSLRGYGSQGEMRSAAIALKLAQAELFYDRTKERPVIFLDDIFSELDHARSQALQQRLLTAHQLFIATARPEDVAGLRDRAQTRVWNVAAGQLSPALAEAQGG